MRATTLTLISVSLDEVRAVLGRPAEEYEGLAAVIDERAAWEPETVPFGQQVVSADEALRTVLAGGPWVPGGGRMYWYALDRVCRAWAWAIEMMPWDAAEGVAEALTRLGVPGDHLPQAWLSRTPRLGLEVTALPQVGRVEYAQALEALPFYEAVLEADLRDEPAQAEVTQVAGDLVACLAEWGREARAVGRPQPDLVVVLG
ncbi:DUF7691 family protein [Kribbia dieselivorans]|uniref:DUF7691 family protein n=1 Tax=Kribbia dieselivorans TaxID=331526 RepID=UPI0008387C55|nr:hypothetical protein [Kribbia dieselivorans]